MNISQKMTTLITLLALALATVPSQAVIKANTNRTNSTIFTDGNLHSIPLNNSGATTLAFTTGANNQKVVITFNAECSVAGTDHVTWLDVDILVDGVIVAPSSSDNAFCTDHGTGALDSWVSAVTVVVYTVPLAGNHAVEVHGTLKVFDAGDQWRIDDSTTLVTQ